MADNTTLFKYLHRGNLAYGRKDYDEARSLYLDAIKVCPNMNEDGNINVLDVVMIIDIITGVRNDYATSIIFEKTSRGTSFDSDGYIGAIEMIISEKTIVGNLVGTYSELVDLMSLADRGRDPEQKARWGCGFTTLAGLSNGTLHTTTSHI